MTYCISDHIISPLGMTSEQNFQAVLAGQSALCRYEGRWGLPEPFTASLFSDEQWASLMIDGLTRFESLVVQSVRGAIGHIDVSDSRTVLILATTKANIDLLQHGGPVDDAVYPGHAAVRIAQTLGFTTQPIVVCNACISGVAALVLAQRLLDAGCYDRAVVCGADVQNRFTVSGFQSLKAVSDEPCRPFDLERLGLNLGEAAATMVLVRRRPAQSWPMTLMASAVRNDAYHVSSPSKNGEGAYLALRAIGACEYSDRLAFVNAHGTATMFNDQMESVAIERAGLVQVPVNGLKGYFGHTMGAAGVLETVIAMHALRHHRVLGTRGFEERGVSGKIRLSAEHLDISEQKFCKDAFVKMISGFGGGNAALLMSCRDNLTCQDSILPQMRTTHSIVLTPDHVAIDGVEQTMSETGDALITWLYKTRMGDYPKFYKMDPLARLALVASDLLLQAEGAERFVANSDRGVILFNHSSSLIADRQYLASIDGDEGFFPSPSVFVYTLPNLTVGEIAMRNHYHGETSFYILPHRDDTAMQQVQRASLLGPSTRSLLTGWVDYDSPNSFTAEMYIIEADFEAGGHTPPALRATSPNLGEDQPSSPSKLEGVPEGRGRVSPTNKVKTKILAKLKENRRELRNNGTQAEAFLWNLLKGKRVAGLQFRRQFSIGNYILDFYCPKIKVAIELDGDYPFHLNQPTIDSQRDSELLNDYGIRTLRFENKTVFTQQYIIVNSIIKAQADFEAGGHTPPALCATSPNLGEDQSSSPSKLEGVPEGRGRVSLTNNEK